MSFGQRRPELLFWTADFEWLKHHKVGIFVEKGNSQRLKKSKMFAFGNSQFTRQHNISLSWANKYRRPGEEQLTKLFTSVISRQLGGRRVGFKFDWEKNIGRCVGTTDNNFHGQRKLSLEQQFCYLIMHVFWIRSKTRTRFLLSVGATVRLRVQIRVRLDSLLMNWTSTREYLEVSNVFVWYKANGFVCWLIWELNLSMNVFVTFAIRSWLLLLICYCHWLHSVINPRMRGYYIYWKVKKSIGE